MTDNIEGAIDASSEPISDPREGREAVIDELRRRWLGPLGGEDELLPRSPVYAYLVGTLYPVEQGTTPDPVAEDVEIEDVEETPLYSSEADVDDDVNASTGDVDEEDTGLNITGAFGWAPQSMGVSFVHSGDVLAVDLRAGVYTKEKAPADPEDDAEKEAKELWRRRQLSEREMVDVTSSGSRDVLGGRARLSWRSRHHSGKRLTTVSLSNDEKVGVGEAKKHPDLCLFQSAMSCSDESGLAPYPQGGVSVSEEDLELSFRYRNKPVFAIGHGVAVDWAPVAAPTTVTTTVLPEVEVAAIRARVGSGDIYSMRWLADDSLDPREFAEALTGVVDDYRAWIRQQREEADAVGDTMRAVADRIDDVGIG